MKLEDRLDFFGDGANIFGLFREFIYLYFADSGATGAFGLRPSVPMDILLFFGLLLWEFRLSSAPTVIYYVFNFLRLFSLFCSDDSFLFFYMNRSRDDLLVLGWLAVK